MNLHTEPAFALRCADDDAIPPALTGVEASGRIDGVLFALTLRQTYRNAGTDPLEVVYSFPLPAGAVLLGFAAEFDGHRIEGHVLASRQAEDVYEEALAQGDAPVLLEVSDDGIHTASIGNLAPGERVTLEVRFAQLMAFEQGRLRIAIPTTIAPRYGDAQRAGLQPQQVPQSSLTADYPFAMTLSIGGPLAHGRIECPTHEHTIEACGDGTSLRLTRDAALDRDVVVVLTPSEPTPHLLVLADDAVSHEAPSVALAAFSIPVGTPRPGVALRLLVDCSGSMAGDSIASAREALHGVLDGLAAHDEISLSRFGSEVRHVLGSGPCTQQHRQRLRAAIDATEASMGGTEMRAALESVFAAWPRAAAGADVLLITDGEVWQSSELVESARRSGHRVFAIGVGSSPAEPVLRDLAEATGGACEFATPGEALHAAAGRMLTRMRQVPTAGLRVDWGAEPVWQIPLPKQVFGGDTLLAMAGFDAPARPVAAARLLAADDAAGASEIARTGTAAHCPGPDLARIAAGRRFLVADEIDALQLALDYQLVTRLTHCVLVHERADEDRTTVEARLQQVPGMLAAGWGGTGSVRFSVASSDIVCDTMSASAEWHSPRSAHAAVSYALDSADLDSLGIPAFLRRRDTASGDPSLRECMRRVHDFLAGGGAVCDLVVEAQDWPLAPALQAAMTEVDGLGIGRSCGWLLLALWVASREGDEGDVARAASLSVQASGIEAADRQRAWDIFARNLGAVPSDAWESARARRLARAQAKSS